LGVAASSTNDGEMNEAPNEGGEMFELEEQFSELCALYDNIFSGQGKKAPRVYEPQENNNPMEKESQYRSYSLCETPSKLMSQSQPPKKIDLLSESDSATSEDNPRDSHVIERALETLPPLSIPNSTLSTNLSQFISKSQFSLPSTKKPYTTVSRIDSHQPWVIIRRYEMRGGKKIRLPHSLQDLIELSGDKLGIIPVCIREVSTEAEIEDVSAIEPDSVLWVMTEEDEVTFCNTD
jgi:hypothetical protein